MELKTRRVEIGGIGSSANGLWMTQIARNLTYAVDGFFAGKRYLIHDRDPLYTKDFLAILAGFRHRIGQTPAPVTESECVCRTVRTHH
jgi:hypothetical protein